MDKIVVGVDTSESARHALRWAILHASQDDQVKAVYLWQIVHGARSQVVPVAELTRLRPQAERLVREVVDDVVAGLDGPLPAIESAAYYGHPGKWLVELSHDADLVVVGDRGLGGFAGLLLGSAR